MFLHGPSSASSSLHNPTAVLGISRIRTATRKTFHHLSRNKSFVLSYIHQSSPPMPPPVIFYPDHWYHDQRRIHCIVPQCGFITCSEHFGAQWTEMHDHCIRTQCTEHKILKKILCQSCCAIDNCAVRAFGGAQDQRLKNLFAHEKSVHGSTDMSDICSFVRLAREGRICGGHPRRPQPDCEELAFDRMLDKVLALPGATVDLLFEKSGFYPPNERTRQTMGKILTDDHLAQPGEHPPFWWPIRAEHFLWRSRPHPLDPPDPHWNMIWTHLREEYANGRI